MEVRRGHPIPLNWIKMIMSHHVRLETNSVPLPVWEQYALLRTEPFLQPFSTGISGNLRRYTHKQVSPIARWWDLFVIYLRGYTFVSGNRVTLYLRKFFHLSIKHSVCGLEDASPFSNSGKPWRGLMTGTNERQAGVGMCVWPLANMITMFPVISSWRVLKYFSLTADHVTAGILRLCTLSTYMVWFMLIRINKAILHECGKLRRLYTSMVDAPTVASLAEADLAWSDEHLGCFWNWAICFLFLWIALPLGAAAAVMAMTLLQGVTASLRVSMQSACQVCVGMRRPRGLSA